MGFGVRWFVLGGFLATVSISGVAQPAALRSLDLWQADAFVWDVFEQRDSTQYMEALSTYGALLEHLVEAPPGIVEGLRKRHLVPLTLILPEHLRAETGLIDIPEAVSAQLPEGTASRLALWWKSVDLVPSTLLNERMAEHLERVVVASTRYADDRTVSGFDERGDIYIRLGPPSHTTRVTDSGTLIGRSLEGYPESVFWVYRHIDDAAQYFFMRQSGGVFRLRLPHELFREARAGLELMEHVYRHLALYSPTQYGRVYEEVADYNFMASTVDPRTMVNRGYLPRRSFALNTRSRAISWDRRKARERDDRVPTSYSNLFDAVETLPVAFRWARFLDPDGTTRTEIYWSLKAKDLNPSRRFRRRLRKAGHAPSESYVLDLIAVRQTADYRSHPPQRSAVVVKAPREGLTEASVVPVRSHVVRQDTGTYHLSLQWDAYWTRPEDGRRLLGPKIKTHALRLDSLEALNAEPVHLEMSDLKPLRFTDVAPLDGADPYAYAGLTPGTQVALYFEVYHLVPDPEGQTRYRVAYEIERPTRRRSRKTTAETVYVGTSSIAREHILLDLSEQNGTGPLTVTVRVTDETTGQTVERTVSFE